MLRLIAFNKNICFRLGPVKLFAEFYERSLFNELVRMSSNESSSGLSFSGKSGVLNVNLKFVKSINEVQLKKNDSLLLIGKGKDLKLIDTAHLASVLNNLQVPENWFKESINYLCVNKEKNNENEGDEASTKSANGSSVSWLNKLNISKISNKYSRNNTPSRAHLVSKAVKKNNFGENQLILVACERKNSVATASAIARAYPLYSSKTGETNSNRNVYATFIYTDELKSSYQISPNDEEIKCFNTLAESIRLTARIVDAPCAEMNTDDFLEEVKKVGKFLGIDPVVVEGEELNKKGFGGIYNVGKAAKYPPKLVVLSSLRADSKRSIAWVGKGIVYDTGGLCLKSRPGMCTMKQDCGGAAAVLGAFYTAIKLGFKDDLHAVFCLAENAIGPDAYKPDDIIKLYSGKTVQITNTDAEGRVVLGDGVAYAKKDLKADIIVDLATLTSAQGQATGKYHAAILTNDEKWERVSIDAGKSSGDLCFPIIFAPELQFSEFDSELADMTNSVAKGDNAVSACAGLFIHAHLGSDYNGVWVHFDIASPVSDGNRATGYGVALLNTLFADSSENQALKSIGPSSGDLPLKTLSDSNDD